MTGETNSCSVTRSDSECIAGNGFLPHTSSAAVEDDRERSGGLEILFYGDGKTNFGDDLNTYLWPRVLPSKAFEARDTALLGIGTILNNRWSHSPKASGKKVFVLGSGAGYRPLPPDLNRWTILAVRGPLSAHLVDYPQAAATDAAALLSTLPALREQTERKRDLTLFMPHFRSLDKEHWQQVAQAAGVTLVDSRWSLETILDLFGRANLVLAEAMHGAIVADSLRIPWIPWTSCATEVLPFKWADWTMSLNLEYKPFLVPSTSLWSRFIRRQDIRAFESQRSSQAHKGGDINGYIEEFHSLYGQPRYQPAAKPTSFSLRRKVLRSLRRTLDPQDIRPAVAVVEEMLKHRPFLSDQLTFETRVEQLRTSVQKFVRAVC